MTTEIHRLLAPRKIRIGEPGKPLDRRPGETIMRIPARAEGDPGTCMNVAFAIAYGIPWEEMPPAASQIKVWGAWAADRGLYLWGNAEYAPVHLPIWIAGVDGLCDPGTFHAVVMQHDEMLLDPNSLGRGRSYDAIRPRDVRMAFALLPAERTTLGGRMWRITNPPPIERNSNGRAD